MYLQFRETFERPIDEIFPYFETPEAWSKLYGLVEPAKKLKGGWTAVPLARFPFPLVARNVECIPGKLVRWEFGGFWRGVGEVRFEREGALSVIEGYEYIIPHGFWLLATLVEERFMRSEFERIWNLGWKRIRSSRREQEPPVRKDVCRGA